MFAIPWFAWLGLVALVSFSLVAIVIVIPRIRDKYTTRKEQVINMEQIRLEQDQFDTLATTFKDLFYMCISLYVRATPYEGIDGDLHNEMVRIKNKYMPGNGAPMSENFSYAQYVQNGISTLKYSSQLIRSTSSDVTDAMKQAVCVACRDFNFTFKSDLARENHRNNKFLSDERWTVYTDDKINEVTGSLSTCANLEAVLASRDLLTGKMFCVLANKGGGGYEAMLSMEDDLKQKHDDILKDEGFFRYGV